MDTLYNILWKTKLEKFENILPGETQLILFDNRISDLFSSVLKTQSSKFHSYVLVLGILQYFFDERKTYLVMIGSMCSFSNCFCKETLHNATFKYFINFYCIFSLVSRPTFIHIPAYSFHVLHICSTIRSGNWPFCCNHTDNNFFRHSICFHGKKTFHRELVINKQFHCAKNTLFCPFHLRLLGWTGVSPKKVVLWIPPTSRQCNCFSILKIDLMKPVIRHRQKLVQEWEIDLAQGHFCKTEFNGVPFLLVQLCPIRDPHAAQLKILWGPV